jgi:type I restriction enzyme M protein
MDAAEYKHLVLGLIFLKYISDTFVEHQQKVLQMVGDPASDYYLGDAPEDHQAALEDRDYYTQENVFWVPADARWESLRARAKQTRPLGGWGGDKHNKFMPNQHICLKMPEGKAIML